MSQFEIPAAGPTSPNPTARDYQAGENMGTQRKYERYPLPPEHVAVHDVPLWDTRAKTLAHDYRMTRDALGKVTSGELASLLDQLRPHVGRDYRFAVIYRAALHEAVVVRHWTVEWSALINKHTVR